MTMAGVTSAVTSGEGEIRQAMNAWVDALRARDIDAMMAHYAPDVVFFDGIAPLRIDAAAYRKNWEEFFRWFPGTVNFEMRGLTLKVGGNIAFASALVNLTGTNAEGKEDGAWMRETIGYEKIGGAWLITHEHWSMPMDPQTGKALTNLRPE